GGRAEAGVLPEEHDGDRAGVHEDPERGEPLGGTGWDEPGALAAVLGARRRTADGGSSGGTGEGDRSGDAGEAVPGGGAGDHERDEACSPGGDRRAWG